FLPIALTFSIHPSQCEAILDHRDHAGARGLETDQAQKLAENAGLPLCTTGAARLHRERKAGSMSETKERSKSDADNDRALTTILLHGPHLRAILNTAPDAMIVIDERGAIVAFSAAAEKMFGYSEEELLGENVSVLMPSP